MQAEMVRREFSRINRDQRVTADDPKERLSRLSPLWRGFGGGDSGGGSPTTNRGRTKSMARVILISYAGYPFTPGSLMPDNGLANLAGALIENGHQVLVLDFGTIETLRRLYPPNLARRAFAFAQKAFGDRDYRPGTRDLVFLKLLEYRLRRHQETEIRRIAREVGETVARFKPHVAGFKLWTGDGFTGSLRIARMLKKSFPSLAICAGGPHVDIFRHLILEKAPFFDALAFGDGEETIVPLVEKLAANASPAGVPNLIYRDGAEVKTTELKWVDPLDDLPHPVYDPEVYPSMAGDGKVKIITVDDSRGCFMGCYFCCHSGKSGSRLRIRQPGNFVSLLERLRESGGFRTFRYAGSSTSTKFARRVAEEMLTRGLEIDYTMFGNIRISRREDFQILQRSGCRAIFFGLESGDQEVLSRGLGKNFNVEKAEAILTACRESGIFTVASVIFPAPFENADSRRNTLEFLARVKPGSVIVTFPLLTPTTAWSKDPERFGFTVKSPDFAKDNMTYKIKWLFPPRFWKPLPYRLNGQGFKEFTRQTTEFTRELKARGFLIGMSDDLVLMAHLTGYAAREGEFLDSVRMTYFAGQWERALELNRAVNAVARIGGR